MDLGKKHLQRDSGDDLKILFYEYQKNHNLFFNSLIIKSFEKVFPLAI